MMMLFATKIRGVSLLVPKFENKSISISGSSVGKFSSYRRGCVQYCNIDRRLSEQVGWPLAYYPSYTHKDKYYISVLQSYVPGLLKKRLCIQ